jgi:hypothetical protein
LRKKRVLLFTPPHHVLKTVPGGEKLVELAQRLLCQLRDEIFDDHATAVDRLGTEESVVLLEDVWTNLDR